MYVRGAKTKKEKFRIIMKMIKDRLSHLPEFTVKKQMSEELNAQQKRLQDLKSKDSKNIEKS